MKKTSLKETFLFERTFEVIEDWSLQLSCILASSVGNSMQMNLNKGLS